MPNKAKGSHVFQASAEVPIEAGQDSQDNNRMTEEFDGSDLDSGRDGSNVDIEEEEEEEEKTEEASEAGVFNPRLNTTVRNYCILLTYY